MICKKIICCIIISITIILSFSCCQNQNDKIDSNSTPQINNSSQNNEISTKNIIDIESRNLDFDETDLIGMWQIGNVGVAAGYAETLRFSEDGEFFHIPNQMTQEKRLIASRGEWKYEKKTNQVTLLYDQQLVIEGGVFQPEDEFDYEAYKGGNPVIKDYLKEEQYTVGRDKIDFGEEEESEVVYTLTNKDKYYYLGPYLDGIDYYQDLFSGKIKIYKN